MLLRSVTVAGFKSLKKQELNLGLVNVLIGQNGAGKSNVLEAIGMLSAAISGSVSYETLAQRGVRLSAPSVYRSALANSERPKTFSLSAEFDTLRYRASIYSNDVRQAESSAWPFHSESLHRKSEDGTWIPIAGRSGKGATIPGQPFDKTRLKARDSIVQAFELIGDPSAEETAAIDALRGFSIYAPSTAVLRGVDTDPRFKAPLGLTGGGLPAAVAETLKSKLVDGRGELQRFFKMLSWCQRIAVEKVDPSLKFRLQGGGEVDLTFHDRFMRRDFNKLYSADVSEGALYIAFILALMLHEKSPRIFALDNVDSTLNPGLVRNIIQNISELAKATKRQVILTTHNPTALDGMDIFDPDHRLYVVDRSESGATELTRLSPPEGMARKLWDEKFAGARLSELWIDGLLGGLTPPVML
ncbi:MAG: AAA family ATPase [Ramlibacter sp.]|nr:AAA family ATPase [Ramlibacter sp.]